MIIWVIAGLLGVATGVRIGWALVNKQSVVSAAMMLALASLGVLAALNWPPLTLLVDGALNWPNISIALSQIALVMSATSSCVMITSVASSRKPVVMRRMAWLHYTTAVVIGAITLALFLLGGRQPEMSPEEYLLHNLGSHTSLPWLLPLLFVVLALTVVAVAGMRYSSRSRRGRALFVFTLGIALIVLASGFFFIRALGSPGLVGVRPVVMLLGCAMLIVAIGALLPTVEDWFGARFELRTIDPLLRELARRQPDIGVGIRPRGPLAFRVAERMSLISDALFLEGTRAADAAAGAQASMTDAAGGSGCGTAERTKLITAANPEWVRPEDQARAVADWIRRTKYGDKTQGFPGLSWLRQPDVCSDREWILAIARQYRELKSSETARHGRD
ncbi:hypothetical protein [Mycobacterium sp.]|uniref:hypothetical protein n=1 Tax=Mycobacterium sp. TaxID=1785 RepID=UPI002D74D649|nr:hypothetical protein [Mycobacterium sp.]HZA10116.1 hypothetical protein [Mycobacterium sp.]